MNILYIPNKDPRLTNGGSEQRSNLLWESLKRYGKVYTFLEDEDLGTDSVLVDGEHPIYKFRFQSKSSPLWRIVASIMCRLSLFSIFSRKLVYIKSPKTVFSEVRFDIVVSRYIYPSCLYKYWEIAPLLIDIDDHPCQVFETEHENLLPFGLRNLGKSVAKWQTNYILNKTAGGWIANEEQLHLCADNYGFLPNIPQKPSREYNTDFIDRKNLFTVGVMSYGPNKNGVSRFLKQIWPLFHQKYPEVRYYIVGKGAPETEISFWNSFDGVEYLGYVENLEKLYEKSLATVVPIYSGGGTCIKTLEAMAYSRPCLSTNFGARGLSDTIIDNEKGVLLFSNAESFVKAYEKLQDSNSRNSIETQGLDVISTHYSVESFNKAVDDIVLNASHSLKK